MHGSDFFVLFLFGLTTAARRRVAVTARSQFMGIMLVRIPATCILFLRVCHLHRVERERARSKEVPMGGRRAAGVGAGPIALQKSKVMNRGGDIEMNP